MQKMILKIEIHSNLDQLSIIYDLLISQTCYLVEIKDNLISVIDEHENTHNFTQSHILNNSECNQQLFISKILCVIDNG